MPYYWFLPWTFSAISHDKMNDIALTGFTLCLSSTQTDTSGHH